MFPETVTANLNPNSSRNTSVMFPGLKKRPELITMSRDVINAFGLRGPVTLQFIRDLARERYLLMEINPRLGGGVVCSVYAGAPITDYILQESLGIPLKTCDDWSDNTLMTRYLKEVIFYKNK